MPIAKFFNYVSSLTAILCFGGNLHQILNTHVLLLGSNSIILQYTSVIIPSLKVAEANSNTV